jgi:hypothetical protein
MSVGQWWSDNWQGKSGETLKKNLLQCHFVHPEEISNI